MTGLSFLVQSFCTKKSYAWLSEHNITEIRDRRILKVVEKENKKVQQKARKERNEEIRGLVCFVRKRDRRVQAQRKLLEQRAAENRRRQAQLDLELVMKRKQELAEHQSAYLNDGYEEQLRQLEKAMQSSDDDGDGDDEGVVLAGQMQDIHISYDALANGDQELDCEFYCVACNKSFKNQSSFRNHESSKKHKENVELIRIEMLQEDGALQSDEEAAVAESDEEEDVEEATIVLTKEVPGPSSGKKKKKQKSKSGPGQTARASSGNEEEEEDEKTNTFLLPEVPSEDDDDWGAASTSKSKAKGKAAKPSVVHNKKERKVKPESAAVPCKDESSDQESEAIDVDHKCVTCAEQFSSKNKLFAHLKKTNHGVYLPKGKVVTQADVPELRKGKGCKRKQK